MGVGGHLGFDEKGDDGVDDWGKGKGGAGGGGGVEGKK